MYRTFCPAGVRTHTAKSVSFGCTAVSNDDLLQEGSRPPQSRAEWLANGHGRGGQPEPFSTCGCERFPTDRVGSTSA
jgi:hypothetical protein